MSAGQGGRSHAGWRHTAAAAVLGAIFTTGCGSTVGPELAAPCTAGAGQLSLPALDQAADTSSIVVVPGMAVRRVFGDLALDVHVAERETRVDVGVALNGRPVAVRTLTPDSSSTELNLVSGGASVCGSLAVRFAYPGSRASLAGDFVAGTGGRALPFRGAVAAWSWGDGTALGTQSVSITPELRAETTILFTPEPTAQVRFLGGTLPLVSITLSQGANEAVYGPGITVGTVRIDPGMRLHLQPPTPTQQGQVYLQGTFGSSNLPVVQYAGAIATWNYVRSP